MLDLEDTASFLLDHGLIDREWIIRGELTLRSAARRNRNIRVEGPGSIGYLIKQPDGLSLASRKTLAAEAAFYRYCQYGPAAAPQASFMPRLVLHDPDRAVHVFELIPHASTLASYHVRHDPESFPLEASRQLGQCLGTLHREFRWLGSTGDPRLDWLDRSIPWVFGAHRRPTPPMLAELSPAGADLFRMIQAAPRLGSTLDSLGRQWRHETLIHGDIRSDNVLVEDPAGRHDAAPGKLWVVDWEFVMLGDPAWDLASAWHDYLVFWTSSMPLQPDLPVETMIDRARYPLSLLRPAIHALWEGYRAAAGLRSVEREDEAHLLLLRAVAFSGARLILAAHELAYEEDTLPTQAVLLLQLALNILADPESALARLYGLPREPGR